MASTARQDKTLLLRTARAIADVLKQRSDGSGIRARLPGRLGVTETKGWAAAIGHIGRNGPRLEVWFDRFTGYDHRKFWFGFSSDDKAKLRHLASRVARRLRPHRTLSWKETDQSPFLRLKQRLGRGEFGLPLLENYDFESYYGMYDLPAGSANTTVNPHLCAHAAAFFEAVAWAGPRARVADLKREVYPKIENRRVITLHLRRERSGLLATERKILDKYCCQVCAMCFEDVYGTIGKDFAESHHRIPLSLLSGKVKTKIDDLATVCANCHRMLHMMDGKRDDVETLRRRLRVRRSGRD